MNKTATKWAIRLVTLVAMTLWCLSTGGILLGYQYEIFQTDSYQETHQCVMQIYRELDPFTVRLQQAEYEATYELELQGKVYYNEEGEIPSIVARNRIAVVADQYRQEIFKEMYQYFLYSNLDLLVVSTENGEKPLDAIGQRNYGAIAEQVVEGYRIYAAVHDPATDCTDGFFRGDLFYRTYKANIPVLVWAFGITTVLSLAGVWLLVKTAGKRAGQEGVFSRKLERFPTDLLYLCGFGGLMILLILVLNGIGNMYGRMSDWLVGNYLRDGLLLLSLASLTAAILVELLVTSTAIRVKTHTFWSNTSVAILWRLTAKGAKKLPTIWRAGLVALGVFAINGILGMVSMYSWITWLLFALYNLFLVVTVCGFAWQMKQLQAGARRLVSGNLHHKIDTSHLYYDCKVYGETLNEIAGGMSLAVEEKLRSQRMKTELITNVSHDIKTPLTSIVTCVELLQQEHTQEERKEHLDLLSRQSMRLKRLVEDLVEASKASTGNVAVHLETLDLVEILDQALGEYQTKLSEKGLMLMTKLPESCSVTADGKLLWRVLDNLLGNVCKYAMEGTRVYVSVTPGAQTKISIKNISASPLDLTSDELLERFVRGDSARTTAGSGLGLHIAQSLMQLQNGALELTVDGDLFKVTLILSS